MNDDDDGDSDVAYDGEEDDPLPAPRRSPPDEYAVDLLFRRARGSVVADREPDFEHLVSEDYLRSQYGPRR